MKTKTDTRRLATAACAALLLAGPAAPSRGADLFQQAGQAIQQGTQTVQQGVQNLQQGAQNLVQYGAAAASCLGRSDRLTCLANLFGPNGRDLCRQVAQSGAAGAGLTPELCDQTYAAGQTAAAAGDQAINTAGGCMANPALCASQLNLDPANLVFAQLKGSLRDESGSPIAITLAGGVSAFRQDASKAPPACQAVVATLGSGALGFPAVADSLSSNVFNIYVPACGTITYTVRPLGPLFAWTPLERTVTVGETSRQAQQAAQDAAQREQVLQEVQHETQETQAQQPAETGIPQMYQYQYQSTGTTGGSSGSTLPQIPSGTGGPKTK